MLKVDDELTPLTGAPNAEATDAVQPLDAVEHIGDEAPTQPHSERPAAEDDDSALTSSPETPIEVELSTQVHASPIHNALDGALVENNVETEFVSAPFAVDLQDDKMATSNEVMMVEAPSSDDAQPLVESIPDVSNQEENPSAPFLLDIRDDAEDDDSESTPLMGNQDDSAEPPLIPVHVSAASPTPDTNALLRAHSTAAPLASIPSKPKISKYSTMPSMRKSMTFRLSELPRSTGHASRAELQRCLSTQFHEDDGGYGSTASHEATEIEMVETPTPTKQKSKKQPKTRRTNRDRGMDDTKWDYVLVFPNPEFEKEIKETQIKYPFIPTMNDMLTKLRQAGLDTQLSKSTNMDVLNVPKDKYVPPFVYCKLSASTDRLKDEAARVHMSIPLVENKLERMAKQGEVRFHIENPEDRVAEIKRQGHEPLPPEKVTKVARRPYKKIQYEAGRELDVFDTFDIDELDNMTDLEDPLSPKSAKKHKPPSHLSALFALFKRFRYRAYQYIHMTYTPQENVQNLYGTPLFESIKRIRLIESIVRSVTGAGLDLDMLVQYGAIAAYYPVHDDDYCRDIRSMWSTSLWLTHQPIEATRNYFGGQAALFLAYVAHITRWLLFPSIFSISLFFGSDRGGYLVWVFGFVMVVWATLFLKMWKRKLGVLGLKWGMTDFHAQDHDRPEYDESTNRHMPHDQFGSMIFFRRVFTFVVFVVFLLLVVATKGGLFYFRWMSKASPQHVAFNIPLMQNKTVSLSYGGELHYVAVLNVLSMCFWSWAFAHVNSFLTDTEVHHTETATQQSYIVKATIYEAINNFAGIFYIAFVKPHVEGIENGFAGPDVEAVEELSVYMLYIYGGQLLFHVLIHVIVPWINHLCCFVKPKTVKPHLRSGQSFESSHDMEAAPLVQPKLLPVEVQFGLDEYGWKGLFRDYVVMVMQFGYATFFVVSCPYLPLMAFVYNLISIRSHSISLVTLYRRLTPRSAQHIRLWTTFLECICFLAIATNSWAIVAKAQMAQRTLDYFGLDDQLYVLVRSVCIAILVVGLFGMGKIFGFCINDIPTRVQIQLERQEYYISKVLHLGYQWDKAMHAILYGKSQEELEAEDGYGWDFAIVFPNPEVRRPPRVHPLTGKVEEVVSMREMILKLHKAGLQVQFFESTAKVSSFIPSMVNCKIRASEKRLEAEAHRVKMPLMLDPKEMESQSKQGVITTVWQRVRKHVLAMEAEMAANSLETLLQEITSVTSDRLDDDAPASDVTNVTWDQLLAQLFLVLNDMVKTDGDIKEKYVAFGIDPARHSSMVRLTSLSDELINELIPQDDEVETLEKQLLNAPQLFDNIAQGLLQASRDVGVQISLLPILLPALGKPANGKRRKEINPNLPEYVLQKTMEDLAVSYAKLMPLLTKMGHLLALTLPLPDLRTIDSHLEKRDLAALAKMSDPNDWLRTELHLIHLMIQDTSLDLADLRQEPLVVDNSLSIAASVNLFIESVIDNPLIDVSPFYLENPDPKFKGLAEKFRYQPYENIYMSYQDKKELQHWFKRTLSLHGPEQLFNSTERLSLIESIITDSEEGAGLHLDKLLISGAIKGYFPLHDDHMKADLWKKWKWSIHQPIEEIRGYFGVKIGLYFAYLGHYTSWLMLSAFVGLSVYVIEMLQKKYVPAEFVQNLSWAKVIAIPIYGVFMVVWAVLFLKYWVRKQWIFSMRWGMSDFHEEEQVRPQFQGELMRDPASGARMRYFSDKQRRWRLMFSWFVIAILICLVLACVAGIFWLRFQLRGSKYLETAYFGNIGTQVAAMANVAQIFMLSQIYNYVCNSLNDYENHRTDSDYENHFVAKAIVFQFVNNFALLFYVAFLKKIFEHECVDNDCMAELNVSLTYVYASQLVIGNCQEVIMPLFWAYVEYLRHEWVKKPGDHEVVSVVEEQFFMPEYGWLGTFWDYLEMIIQFGYSTFFVLACPLAPVFSFCNNIFEIRIDGSKISKFCRRPRPSGASTIGQWVKVLDVFVIITIITNSWIIATTSNFGELILPLWPKFDEFVNPIGLFFTLAGILVGVKGLINSFIPDMPRHVHAQLKRQKFLVSKILSTHEEAQSSSTDSDN
ncbi:Aste57867_19535 [Aphanomyces stellatus]|uniref:Aste57867_19535 protein n=1 Tax=Aphanomyces stellatus TaxID=120398 RepID=A0A485LCW3_9STRA|nr:hypothetical protein As57867_019471 [Aphanomyces stellatus]VFT96242.1 Aste57867_19535 [Aphanomyces stellatus]